MNSSQLKEQLLQAKKITIVTHKNPDGDAIGSSYGLCNLINKINPCAKVVVPNDFPKFLNWIENVEEILIWEKTKELVEQQISDSDVIFCLDFNALHRVDQVGELIDKSNAVKAMIDHHLSPDDFADYTKSIISASSTAELVFEFILELGYQKYIDKGIAEALYCGIMTDTGSFKYPSTSSRTHEIAAELIKYGADNGNIHSLIYDSNSINRLRILGHCLDTMEIIADEFSLFAIPKKVQEDLNLEKGDTEGIVNYGLSVKEIKASAFLREDDGIIKISFRSKGDFDVNVFARTYFSGGGHKNAAGGMSSLSLEECKAYFKKSILEYAQA